VGLVGMSVGEAEGRPLGPRLQRYALADRRAPSPGAVHGCRVCARAASPSSMDVFVADGPAVLRCQVPWGESSEEAGGRPMGGGGPGADAGKDDLLLPEGSRTDAGIPCSAWEPFSGGRAEVQHLSLSRCGKYLGAVDARGRAAIVDANALVSGGDVVGGGGIVRLQAGPGASAEGATLEPGWGGLAFDQVGPSGHAPASALVRHWQRTLDLFDHEARHVRRMHGAGSPLAAAWLSGVATGCVATTEGHHLVLWDPRVAEGGGVVRRIVSPTTAPLWTLAASEGRVCVGTGDRRVLSYDPRSWAVAHTLNSVLKNDVTGLALPADDAPGGGLYAAGVDPEVVAHGAIAPTGTHSGAKRSRRRDESRGADQGATPPIGHEPSPPRPVSFRGEGRSLGLALATLSPRLGPRAGDVVLNYSASGAIHVLSLPPHNPYSALRRMRQSS